MKTYIKLPVSHLNLSDLLFESLKIMCTIILLFSLWGFFTLNFSFFSRNFEFLVLLVQFKVLLSKIDVRKLNITLFFQTLDTAMTVTGLFHGEVTS